jgi:hypothetical protein
VSIQTNQFSYWAGDTLPAMVFRIVAADGGAQDLTGAVATITIIALGTTGAPILQDGAQIFDQPGGGVQYSLPRPLTLPVDVNGPELYAGQLTFHFGSGKVLHSDKFGITVSRPLDG